ncbi:MAG TPA: A24 family peptidase [Gemmatimonadaceae bacterium]
MTFPAPHLLPLGVCLLIAIAWDVARRRVPNLVTGAVALLGMAAQLVDKGGWSALSGLAAAALSLLVLYRPWAARALGGGDVKMAAAVAIWVGLGSMFQYALAVAAVGGVVGLVMYFVSGKSIRANIKANLQLAVLQQTFPSVEQRPARLRLPYGIAIAAGAAFALLT